MAKMLRRVPLFLLAAVLWRAAAASAAGPTGPAGTAFSLKAQSVYCATPQPLVSGHVYPLALSGCDVTPGVWELVAAPRWAANGIMQVDMGKEVGIRYVKAFSIVKSQIRAPSD